MANLRRARRLLGDGRIRVSYPAGLPGDPSVTTVDVSPIVTDATWAFDGDHDDCPGDREVPVFAGSVGVDSEVGTLTCCDTCGP